MSVKTVSTRMSIIGRGARCSGGRSAVEQSAYISRTSIYSEYYGETFHPKYAEDLVSTNILLPPQAPREYLDRARLWNSIEAVEKHFKAQLARLYKVSLPNEWSYELATSFMEDYIQRNFVSKGMCAEYAIHDSVNKKGVHNLHCHIILTMRPILDNGEWGDKQRKIYKLDADGNKIKKKNGRYDCTTEKTTDWDNKENAKIWRRNLVEGINTINEAIGSKEDVWEWRSFKDRGQDLIPTIHLGEQATALERKGIHTDKGDYNREVRHLNSLIEQGKMMDAEIEKAERIKREKETVDIGDKEIVSTVKDETLQMPINDIVSQAPIIVPKPAVADEIQNPVIPTKEIKKQTIVEKVVNEVLEFIHRIMRAGGRMNIPVAGTRHIAKIGNRERLSDPRLAEEFINKNHIETFAQLETYVSGLSPEVQRTEDWLGSKKARLKRLRDVSEAYGEYAPLRDMMKRRDTLGAISRIKFDKEHKAEIEAYPDARNKFHELLGDGLKVTPKKWSREIKEIEDSMKPVRERYVDAVMGLATAEVIIHTRKDEIRREQTNRGRAYGQMLNKMDKPDEPRKSFVDILEDKDKEAERINTERMTGAKTRKSHIGKTEI